MKKIDEMTPEELRIACAEKLGWSNVQMVDDICLGTHDGVITAYDTDSNALLELIMAVPEKKHDKFILALEKILFDRDLPAITVDWIYKLLTADPFAIMRAFLTVMEEK